MCLKGTAYHNKEGREIKSQRKRKDDKDEDFRDDAICWDCAKN